MTFIAVLFHDHQIIKLVHTLISVTFLCAAIWLFYRSIRGYIKNLGYSRLDKSLSYIFIVNLYLQLIFGLLLMANPAPLSEQEMASQDIAVKMVSNRFWPIEHIVLMVFALFIANLGLIFSNSTQIDRERHRKVLVYYTIALIMISLSLSSTYLI